MATVLDTKVRYVGEFNQIYTYVNGQIRIEVTEDIWKKMGKPSSIDVDVTNNPRYR